MLARRRPISWVKRQGSSGTLPERITDEAKLLVSRKSGDSSSFRRINDLVLSLDCES